MPTSMLVRLTTFGSAASKPHNAYIVVALLALTILFISLYSLFFILRHLDQVGIIRSSDNRSRSLGSYILL
jgi:hypothetical protein